MNSFSFGKNWISFVKNIEKNTFDQSLSSFDDILGIIKINKGNFLDIGSGSGLFSLAAKKRGFNVSSFDVDINSVKATQKIKNFYYQDDEKWEIFRGNILDNNFLEKKFKKKFDFVYSWGVLHHTGNMYKAIENAASLVNKKGFFVISIYNDQGVFSNYWKIVKKLYNKNSFFKLFSILFHSPYFLFFIPLYKFLKKDPFDKRGMVIWNNYLDWIGGYPFEVASPLEIESFFTKLKFHLIHKNLVGKKLGCNEFIFRKN